MEIYLSKKPKKPLIIEGFPGLGFVGTIAAEYLIDKLGAESIGYIWSDKMPPIATVHKKKLRKLLEIFYVKEKNIVLMHALSGIKGIEWELADAVFEVAKKLGATEVISLEGVGSPFGSVTSKTFYYTESKSPKKKFAKINGIDQLKEGMVVGVSGAIMLKAPRKMDTSFIFVETHSNVPDSNAAASLITVLDKYVGLAVDPKPLIKEAKNVQSKLKEIMQKTKKTKEIKNKKDLNYVG